MAYVTWVLRHCNHNGFPVVRGAPGDSEDDRSDNFGLSQEEGTSSREGPLEGVILRSQLMVLLINKVDAPPLYAPVSPDQAQNCTGILPRVAVTVTLCATCPGAAHCCLQLWMEARFSP